MRYLFSLGYPRVSVPAYRPPRDVPTGKGGSPASPVDRARLAAIAARIGPTVADVTGRSPELDPRLVANWDARGGYLKPPEEVDADELDELLNDDVAHLGAPA